MDLIVWFGGFVQLSLINVAINTLFFYSSTCRAIICQIFIMLKTEIWCLMARLRWRPERLMTSEESRRKQQSVELCRVLKWGANSHLQRQDSPPPPHISLPLCLLTHKYPQAVIHKPPTHACAHHHDTKQRRDCATLTDFRATETTHSNVWYVCPFADWQFFDIYNIPSPKYIFYFDLS